MLKQSILVLCWILASARLVSAATYYVNSSTGNDSNNGSSAAPWKTLHTAIPKLSAGDTLNCTGTFDEPNNGVSWDYSVSGTASSPITIQGYGAGATVVMEASSSIWYGIHRFDGNYINIQNLGITSHGNSAGGIVNGGVAISFSGNNCSMANCEASNITAQVVTSGDTCIVMGNYGNYNTYSNVFVHDVRDSDIWRMFGSYNLMTHCVISNCMNANYSSGGNHADLMQSWALSSSAISVSNVFDSNLCISNGIPGSGVGPGLGISGGMLQCLQSGNNFSSISPNIHDWVYRNNVFSSACQEIEVEMPQMHFYNNVFYNYHGGMGCMYLYNNTTASGAHFYNNVFINSPISDLNGGSSKTMDCNALDSISSSQSQNLTFGTYGLNNFATTATAAGFVNPNAGDFHLKSGSALIGKGINLYNDPSMSRTDKDGVARPSSGAWDIGPYQYNAGGPSTNPVGQVSPASMSFGSIPMNTSVTNSLVIQNVGGGTLAGTASVPPPFYIVSGAAYSLTSNQTQTVNIRYSPTLAQSDSQIITFTGGGGATANLSGSAWAVLPGLSFESYAGTITAPFATNSAGYISQSSQTTLQGGGRAVYGFSISTAGDYVVAANVNAPDTTANSFYVNIDAEPTDPTSIWDVPVTSGFTNQVVSWRGNGTVDTSTNQGVGYSGYIPQYAPMVFTLSAGLHQLIIVGREAGAQLGTVSIQQPLSPPTNLHIVSGGQ
jgi:hypothetical protein